MGRKASQRRRHAGTGRGAASSKPGPQQNPQNPRRQPFSAAGNTSPRSSSSPSSSPHTDTSGKAPSSSLSSSEQAELTLVWDMLSKDDKLAVLQVQPSELVYQLVAQSSTDFTALLDAYTVEEIASRMRLRDVLDDPEAFTMLSMLFVESVRSQQPISAPLSPAMAALVQVWQSHLTQRHSRVSGNAHLLLFSLWFLGSCPHVPGAVLSAFAFVAVFVVVLASSSLAPPLPAALLRAADAAYEALEASFPADTASPPRPDAAQLSVRCAVAGLVLVSTSFWSDMYAVAAVAAVLPSAVALSSRFIASRGESSGLAGITSFLLLLVRLLALYFCSTWLQFVWAAGLLFPYASQVVVGGVGLALGLWLAAASFLQRRFLLPSSSALALLAFVVALYSVSAGWSWFAVFATALASVALPEAVSATLTAVATVYAPMLSACFAPVAGVRLLFACVICGSALVSSLARTFYRLAREKVYSHTNRSRP